MITPLNSAKELAQALLVRRSSALENGLAKMLRALLPSQKLEIISFLSTQNVRLAAALAARGRLEQLEQGMLLESLLQSERSNALKHMIEGLFANRMRGNRFVALLNRHSETHPKGVSLAAYYFSAARQPTGTLGKEIARLAHCHSDS